MKRRDFIAKGTAGALAAGAAAGAWAAKPKKRYEFKPEKAPFSFKVTVPKPQGTMPTSEFGKMGIKLSKLGFGSHMSPDILRFTEEREKIIREAFDLGVTLFDIYDIEQKCFQYEPMGRYLKPIINDVFISISFQPNEGRTDEQEFERDLKLFGRDHIDLVRFWVESPDNPTFRMLLKFKEQGKVRAIGMMVHDANNLDKALATGVPLDFALLPFNFYHNICWLGEKGDDFSPLIKTIREKGMGLLTMKPFAGDFLVTPFIKITKDLTAGKPVNFPQAAQRYILNSGINADSTLTGMYTLSHLYENVAAYYNPTMTKEERELLDNLREAAESSSQSLLPDHYKWLDRWAPTSPLNRPTALG
jgi:aryl-alcohol dehydrogenase-like predicted oxidoreductase